MDLLGPEKSQAETRKKIHCLGLFSSLLFKREEIRVTVNRERIFSECVKGKKIYYSCLFYVVQ